MKCPEQVNPEREKADWRLPGAGGGEDGLWLLKGEGGLWTAQWLGLCACTAEGAAATPARGTRVPQAARRSQTIKIEDMGFLLR